MIKENPSDNYNTTRTNASRQTGGNEYTHFLLCIILSLSACFPPPDTSPIDLVSFDFQPFYCCFRLSVSLACIAIKNKSKGLDWAISRVTHRARVRESEWDTHSVARKNQCSRHAVILLQDGLCPSNVSMFSLPASYLLLSIFFIILFFSLFWVSCRRLFSSLCFIFSCVCCCHSLVFCEETNTVFRSDPFGLRACGRSVAKHNLLTFAMYRCPTFCALFCLSFGSRNLFHCRSDDSLSPECTEQHKMMIVY